MEAKTTQQPDPMHAQPQEQHRWLHRLVGEWTYEGEAFMEPGQSPARFKGVEHVRSLGGLWIVAESKGEMPGGGEATMIMTLGFDPRKNRYTGTWLGSMMAFLWVYDGELDAGKKILSLHAEGPDFTVADKTARYKDVIEIIGDDHRRLSSYVADEKGNWNRIMTADYRRKQQG